MEPQATSNNLMSGSIDNYNLIIYDEFRKSSMADFVSLQSLKGTEKGFFLFIPDLHTAYQNRFETFHDVSGD